MLRVGVIGARGRMGIQVCQAVNAAADLELVAALDAGDDLENLTAQQVSVAVHFTTPDAVLDNVSYCIQAGIDSVIGTSGMTDDTCAAIRELLAGKPGPRVLVVPNFALGAVLMMAFARQAGRYFQGVEIIEAHHPGKVDAPSGTATSTAAQIAKARMAADMPASPDATTDDPLGARGGVGDGIHIHSVRLPGLVAHQEVLLGNPGELLTIRHDCFDRASFMPGVLLAIRNIGQLDGFSVGLEQMLESLTPLT